MLELARRQPIPVPWDRDAFVRSVSELRGRPITLIPTDTVALADSPCGLWLARDDDDLILHEVGTTEYHIDQIVGHEIGHILLNHHRTPAGDDVTARKYDLCRQVMPDLDPETVRTVLGRNNCDSEHEREAETFASLLMIAAAELNDTSSTMMRNAFFRHR